MTRKTSGRNTRAEQRRIAMNAILDASAHEFAHLGFEGASMNVIAKKSGISKQNMIYYFGSKDELWKATVADIFGKVNEDFRDRSAAIGQAGTFEELIMVYFNVARRYPAYVLIPMIEGINPSWRSKLLAEEYLKPHMASFVEITSSLVEAGEIADVPALHLQNLVTGGAQLYLALAPLWKYATGSDTTEKSFLNDYGKTVSRLLSSKTEN